MKFLVNENIGSRLVKFLRSRGYDVISVQEKFQGKKDAFILKKTRLAGRIVITYDKDFGELVFKSKIQHSGVILLRTRDESAKTQIRVLKFFLREHPKEEIKNYFWVVTDAGARRAIIV